jgi:hypothetical protein
MVMRAGILSLLPARDVPPNLLEFAIPAQIIVGTPARHEERSRSFLIE